MCRVCVEWQKGLLTNREALRNLGELIDSNSDQKTAHYWRVIDEIMEKELPTSEPNAELDETWQNENNTGDKN